MYAAVTPGYKLELEMIRKGLWALFIAQKSFQYSYVENLLYLTAILSASFSVTDAYLCGNVATV
jgi:hypothetical protein